MNKEKEIIKRKTTAVRKNKEKTLIIKVEQPSEKQISISKWIFSKVIDLAIFVLGMTFVYRISAKSGLSEYKFSSPPTIFVKNENTELNNWVDKCSYSEKVCSEIKFYFDYDREEINSYLKNPNEESTESSLLKNPNFIFQGKPGTGKSHCALAIAKNISSAYAIVSGGTLQEIFVGSGARAWKKIIDDAKETSKKAEKPVVIIVEEIDSLANAKGRGYEQKSDDTLVNTLLESVDSIRKENLNIIIIGTTNVIWNMEPAAVRTGRFHQLNFDYPDKSGLDKMLKNIERQIRNKYEVVINYEIEPSSFSNGKKKILIPSEYWDNLEINLVTAFSTRESGKDNYTVTFVRISFCVEKSIIKAIANFRPDAKKRFPSLGKVSAHETSGYIMEIVDKEQENLVPRRIRHLSTVGSSPNHRNISG